MNKFRAYISTNAALDRLFFFKNLFYQSNWKEAINIGDGQIKGLGVPFLTFKSN